MKINGLMGLGLVTAGVLGVAASAFAADYGAQASSAWNSAGTWTPAGGPPGAADNAYIGSTIPGGALAVATVSLTQNQAVNNLFLGNGAGTSGTLNLNAFTLTAARLTLGNNGSTGAIQRAAGSALNITNTLTINNGGVLNFDAADAAANLTATTNSTATTAATGNITQNALLESGGVLNLGAALNLAGSLDIRNGTVNAQGNAINAPVVRLGFGANGFTLNNPGAITATTLYVANNDFSLRSGDQTVGLSVSNATTNLIAAQSVTSLDLDHAVATTNAAGNISQYVQVYNGSTLNLGADLNLTVGYLDIEGNSVVNANNHAITAPTVYVGWSNPGGTLNNPGAITATNLRLRDQNFSLRAGDQVGVLHVDHGATSLIASQSVQGLNLYNAATGNTTATGNITSFATINSGSTLTLGAALNLGASGTLTVQGATLNAQGNAINTGSLSLFSQGSTPGSLLNDGAITADSFTVSGGAATLTGGNDAIGSTLSLINAARLKVVQADGATTGLTLNGTTANSLQIQDTSVLDLQLGDTTGDHWVFRWADPSGGDWVSTLTNLVNQGRITVTAPSGFGIYNQGGYTYIGLTAVPEPSALALLGLGLGALGLFARRCRS